jgi:signal transduction histidine kinase
VKRIIDFFPHGNTLSEEVFRKRHDFLSAVLAIHLPALFVFGVWRGYDAGATALELSIPLTLLILARVVRNRRLDAFFITGGLVYCSSALVHLSGGTIEAHFHFFVLIGLIALYQDWVPFAWNFAFTILSHGLGSAIDSDAIFNHHAAQQNPWGWATIHGVSVALACVGVTIFWRSTEQEQQRNNELVRELATAELAHAQAQAAQRESISELFINLARRNQTLLNRQLELIADLEQRERRPEELGELFKLDHLATRIRRNAESLLVLSGDDPPRRWGRPVPLGDVVRAAAAEVEDYRRVEVLVSDHLEVVGRAVADLAHMLAELIENATTFSPPGSEVRVRSHLSPGEESNYVLSIEDVGIGMSDADLIAANEMLADPPDIDPRRSRLGFHVVARLAQRYGLVVTLASTPGGGVTAMVMLPHDLVTERRPALPSGGAPPAGLNVYALPDTAPPGSPGADPLTVGGLRTAQGWQAAPAVPGVDPPPAEAWQAPPPIPTRGDVIGEGPAIPRETWEIAPSDALAQRPMGPTAWQSPPPIAPQEPVVPPEAPVDASLDAPVAPAPAAPAPPDPSEALLRGRPRRFRPSPDRWGPAPATETPEPPAEPQGEAEPTSPPADVAEPVAEAPVAAEPADAPVEAEAEAEVAAPAVGETAAEVPAEDEVVASVEVEVEVEVQAVVATEGEGEVTEGTGAEPVDVVEVVTAVEAAPSVGGDESEATVEDEVVDAELEPEVAVVADDEPIDAEIVEDEALTAATDVEPVPEPEVAAAATDVEREPESQPEPEPQLVEAPVGAVDEVVAEPEVRVAEAPRWEVPVGRPADPQAPPVLPRVAASSDFAPVPPPPPFVVMPPVPSPPVDHPQAPEAPAAMAPPPIAPSPVVPPAPPVPFEVAPSDEVARPFIDFGQPPDGRFERPSYTGWPPTNRTPPADPSTVPAFLTPPPPGHPGGPPAPGTPAAPPADAAPTYTADGLVKRVPGQRLASGLQSRAPRAPGASNGGPRDGAFEPPLPDARRQHTSSMLSRFQNMQRTGRAAAEAAEDPPDPEEPS